MAYVNILLVALLTFACGEKDNTKDDKQITRNSADQSKDQQGEIKPPLEGSFLNSKGERVDLSKHSEKPTVLIFAHQFCETCNKETKELSALFEEKGGVPQNINLYTVLIRAYPEDLEDWLFALDVPVQWIYGRDQSLELFFKYFPKGTKTPAMVVHTPTEGIVLQKQGPKSIAEIEELTGPWEFEK